MNCEQFEEHVADYLSGSLNAPAAAEFEAHLAVCVGRGIIMREQITLACAECKRRNYSTMKNKRNTTDRVEMSKYCPWCRKHTPHRETK